MIAGAPLLTCSAPDRGSAIGTQPGSRKCRTFSAAVGPCDAAARLRGVLTERREWTDLPAAIVSRVSDVLGSDVVRFQPAPGGFAVGAVVGLVHGADGRALFVKGVPAAHPAAGDYRNEASLLELLPPPLPFARLQSAVDDQGWVLLLLDALKGKVPQEPWSAQNLRAALATLGLTTGLLTPTPVADAPTLADRMRGRCQTYGRLLATGSTGRLRLLDVTDWERGHLARLAAQEAHWDELVVGQTLLHFDLRHDNCIVQANGEVAFVDWGRACVGPAWVDLVCLLLLSDTGATRPWKVFDRHQHGTSPDPAAVDAFLVALASYWRTSAAQPVPGSPHLQVRRAKSRDATIGWLRHRWGDT